jgi:hypothetical protein
MIVDFLVYSTYFGGSQGEWPTTSARQCRQYYLTGYTLSPISSP